MRSVSRHPAIKPDHIYVAAGSEENTSELASISPKAWKTYEDWSDGGLQPSNHQLGTRVNIPNIVQLPCSSIICLGRQKSVILRQSRCLPRFSKGNWDS